VLLIAVDRGVRYWLYYKPLYALFGESLFLPFWLHIAGLAFGGGVLVLLSVVALRMPPRPIEFAIRLY
jgi:hypothetical protein